MQGEAWHGIAAFPLAKFGDLLIKFGLGFREAAEGLRAVSRGEGKPGSSARGPIKARASVDSGTT
jgi:hypothetical protein